MSYGQTTIQKTKYHTDKLMSYGQCLHNQNEEKQQSANCIDVHGSGRACRDGNGSVEIIKIISR